MIIFVRPSSADKIVTFDSAAGTNGGNGGSVTSLTWTQSVSNSESSIIVLASFNGLRTITATCDGVQMMPITTISNGTSNYLAAFVIFNISSGNKNITITADSSVNRMQGQSAVYSNGLSFTVPNIVISTTANATISSSNLPPLIMLLSNTGTTISAGADTQLRNYQSSDGTASGSKGAILEGTNVVNATYTGTSTLVGFNLKGADFSLPPGRTHKTTVQSLPGAGWGLVTGWDVSPGYQSGTSLVSDKFVVTNSGTYSLIANDQRTASQSSTACRILVNGTIVATSTSGTALSSIFIQSINLNQGDTITMEAYIDTVGTTARTISDSGTYIQIIPV